MQSDHERFAKLYFIDKCSACGKSLSELEFSIILERGIFRNGLEVFDPPEKWVQGIVKCWCGKENELLRIVI